MNVIELIHKVSQCNLDLKTKTEIVDTLRKTEEYTEIAEVILADLLFMQVGDFYDIGNIRLHRIEQTDYEASE